MRGYEGQRARRLEDVRVRTVRGGNTAHDSRDKDGTEECFESPNSLRIGSLFLF